MATTQFYFTPAIGSHAGEEGEGGGTQVPKPDESEQEEGGTTPLSCLRESWNKSRGTAWVQHTKKENLHKHETGQAQK